MNGFVIPLGCLDTLTIDGKTERARSNSGKGEIGNSGGRRLWTALS